jgi:uncharacterized membrane protein YfcA
MPAPLDAVFASWEQFALVFGVILVAEAIYVLFGFGAGLIAVGTLALVLPGVQDVVVVLMLVNIPAELFVVSRTRQSIAWGGIGLVVIGLLVGVPVGSSLLEAGEPTAVLTALGAVLMLVGGTFLLLPAGAKVDWPAPAGTVAGLVAGLLAGLFGTGGPPLIVYFHLAGIPKRSFRGTLMAVFFLVGVVRVPVYAAIGLITVPRLVAAAAVFPAVLAGAAIGNRAHVELAEQTFRRMVSVLLVVIGGVLLARSLA